MNLLAAPYQLRCHNVAGTPAIWKENWKDFWKESARFGYCVRTNCFWVVNGNEKWWWSHFWKHFWDRENRCLIFLMSRSCFFAGVLQVLIKGIRDYDSGGILNIDINKWGKKYMKVNIKQKVPFCLILIWYPAIRN